MATQKRRRWTQIGLFLVIVLTLATMDAFEVTVINMVLRILLLCVCFYSIAASERREQDMKDFRTSPQRPDTETAIHFTELYDTHRVGFYKDWLIIQPYDALDGDIKCYLPSEEWESGGFDSLVHMQDYHVAEWEAGNLNEAIDFIDGYCNFEETHAAGLN